MFYARHESGKLGSDGTLIFKDLKTVRGVQRRIEQSNVLPGLWTIYRCTEDNWYRDAEHKWAGQARKENR